MSPIQTFYTVPAGSPIKTIQRGSAGGAGTVTISSVDISKSFVTIQGTAASGTVAATGSVNASSFNIPERRMETYAASNSVFNLRNDSAYGRSSLNLWWPAASVSMNAQNISGGSTNLVAAQVTGYLSNSTSLVVSGACRYEVVEYN